MFEIAISARSRNLVPATRYDKVAGSAFENKDRAEEFCRDLNHFCHQERFLVVRVGRPELSLRFPVMAHMALAA